METVKISFFEKLIINFAGYDVETVANSSSAEKKRVVTLGLTLFVPVLLGTFSGGYAIATIAKNPNAAWYGLVYGFIIYLIDRAMLSITNQNWITYVGRMLLAVIVGLVISLPIKLLIFDDSIQEELHAQAQKERNNIENKYAAVISQKYNEINNDKLIIETDYKAWMTEMDGSGGTQKRGRGNIADVKENEYRAKATISKAFQAMKYAEIDSLRTVMTTEINEKLNAQGTGLLSRYNALGRVAGREPFVKTATYILWAFLTLLELVPLLVKMASSGNLYDSIIKSNNTAKLLSVENTNVLKAEAETLAQKKVIQSKMNQVKIDIAMNDVDNEVQMAEMYIKKIVEMSKNESKKTKEIQKTDLSETKKDELTEKLAHISTFYGDRVYQSPFQKQSLYDTI